MDDKKIALAVLVIVAVIGIVGLVMTFGAKAKVTGNYVWWDTYRKTGVGNQYANSPTDLERYGTQSVRTAYSGYASGLANQSAQLETSIT